MEKKKITIFISIPTYYRMFAELNLTKCFSNCRKLTSSSAPLPQDVSKKFYEKGIKITEIYGSTETGGIAHRVSAVNMGWQLFSYVKVFKEWNDYINNENVKNENEDIELRINSPAISVEYNKEKGFNTGDIIKFTDNGTFILLGRNIRFVKIAGKRVDLQFVLMKVREYLNQNNNCQIKDDELYIGEKEEKIYIISEKGFPKTSKEIKKDLNKLLPSYAIPRIFINMKIPRNNMGKIKKVEIEKIIKNK
jgi:acyl-coenzyme A synthetase/AMP-(fatty) acid ligase